MAHKEKSKKESEEKFNLIINIKQERFELDNEMKYQVSFIDYKG